MKLIRVLLGMAEPRNQHELWCAIWTTQTGSCNCK